MTYTTLGSPLKSGSGYITTAEHIVISDDDPTNIKTYIDSKVSEGGASSTDVTDLQKRVAAIEALLKLV